MKGLSDVYLSKDYRCFVNEIENKVIVNDNELEDQFYYPRGIDICKDKIFVTDSYNHMIKIFEISGKKINEFGKGVLVEPYGIKCFNEKIYCCNKDNDCITVFNLKGDLLENIDLNLKKPAHLEIYEKTLYITDVSGILTWMKLENGNNGKFDYRFQMPRDIKVTKSFVYVADEFDSSIKRFTKEGIFVDNILEEGYFSLISIDENQKMTAYDEKTGSFSEIELNEPTIEDIEKFLEDKKRIGELFYYLVEKDDFDKVEKYFCKGNWDKNKKELNLKLYKHFKDSEFTQFLERNYPIDMKLIKRLGCIRKIEDTYFKNPKALFVVDKKIYIGLFNHKLLLQLNSGGELELTYGFEILVDKLVITQNRMIVIDYFYRKVYSYLNVESSEYEIVGENHLENPVDLLIVENKVYILDSVKKKVYVFTAAGKKVREYSIEGTEPIALEKYSNGFILLDKREHKITVYSEHFEKKDEINLDYAAYPDDICVDNNDKIYVSDEMNSRILKIGVDGELVYEISDFERPRDIFYQNGILYVNDFGDASLKYYEVK